jgi:predicted dehydrogenase
VRAAIVGCGLIGRKRAFALAGARLVVCCDVRPERALALASEARAEAAIDWQETVRRRDVDLVIVATTHEALAPVAAAAASAGKHVLIEKPGARRAAELEPVREAARRAGVLVRVGYNHRYHRAIRQAFELVDAGALGELMFLRARYGHGGRPGYEREWRAQPELSGGGELIDQGSHLIDLARRFLGDFCDVKSFLGAFYWPMAVEDNCFLLLRTQEGRVASLHASWTEWKNLFSLEIYGRAGKIEVSGLGGSYGTERLTLYRMRPEMGPPETTTFEYPMPDDSWQAEFAEFLEDIRLGRAPQPGLADAQAVLRLIQRIYEEARP